MKQSNLKMKKYQVASLNELKAVSQQFLQDFGTYRLVSLVGEMGAGKTTFVKTICEILGVDDAVSSPTFSIVNEYTTSLGDTLFHFDFYRIDSEQEALDFGVEEYWDSDAFCFMEWAERVEALLPSGVLEVNIVEQEEGRREITVKINEE